MIGTDDYDDLDGFDESELQEEPKEQEQEQQQQEESQPDKPKDFIDDLLNTIGIQDRSKIVFENEDGTEQETNWDDLSNSDKLNIIHSSINDPDSELDDEEIQMLNDMRTKGLSPSEYIQDIARRSVNNYIQNAQQNVREYNVDSYTDDELYVAHLQSTIDGMSDDEAQQALTEAHQNENLFKKQIDALRKQYKMAEDDNLRQQQYEIEEQSRIQYQQFARSVADEINNLTDISGYDLNLEDADKQELFDFLTGQDGAGVNHFQKVLSNPRSLVQAAWFALNGKQMIEDITSYFKKEIADVSRTSYARGQKDAQKGSTYKPKSKSAEYFDDI